MIKALLVLGTIASAFWVIPGVDVRDIKLTVASIFAQNILDHHLIPMGSDLLIPIKKVGLKSYRNGSFCHINLVYTLCIYNRKRQYIT